MTTSAQEMLKVEKVHAKEILAGLIYILIQRMENGHRLELPAGRMDVEILYIQACFKEWIFPRNG
ncbi:MAG: hypothetical protein MHMPM18_001908 [Marteilia pararefringens]